VPVGSKPAGPPTASGHQLHTPLDAAVSKQAPQKIAARFKEALGPESPHDVSGAADSPRHDANLTPRCGYAAVGHPGRRSCSIAGAESSPASHRRPPAHGMFRMRDNHAIASLSM
jgi:hypothetical protein